MAEKKRDCSELSSEIAKAAFIIADSQVDPTLVTVAAQLNEMVDINISSDILAEAILDFTFEAREAAKNRVLRGSSVIKAEAVRNEKLTERISRLISDIKRGLFEGPAPRLQRRISDETQFLVKQRDQLKINESQFLSFEKGIKRFEKMFKTGDFRPGAKRAVRPDIESVSKLRAKKERLGKGVAERRAETARIKRGVSRVIDLGLQLDSGIFKKLPKKQQKKVSDEVKKLRNIANGFQKKIKLRQEIDSLTRQLKGIDPLEIAKPKSPRFDDPELLNLKAKKRLLRNEVDRRIRRLKPLNTFEKIGEAGNISRIMLTMADLSASLRQGGKLVLANPTLFFRNFGPMLKAMASEDFTLRVEEAIVNNPNFWMYETGKLKLSDRFGGLAEQEEFFSDRGIIDKMPIIGSIKKGSERAFTTFLNLIRTQAFDQFVSNTRNQLPTQEELSGIGNAINILTGAGDLGKFQGASTFLNQFLFAARYVTSQFQTLTLNPIRKAGSPEIRKQVIWMYARMLMSFGLLATLADMFGFDVEYDPRSTDFLKFRSGKTRVDMGTGLIQPIVLVSRIASGQSKSPVSGRISQLRGEDQDFGTSGFEVLSRFGRSKLSPGAAMFINLAIDGKNVIGEPVSVTSVNGIVNLTKNQLLPISVQEIAEILKEEENLSDAAIFSLLSILGAGISTFDTKESKPQRR